MSQCSARKRSGDQCGSSAMRGSNVCRMHGGQSPQAKAKAAERLAEQKAAQALARRGQQPPERIADAPAALVAVAERQVADELGLDEFIRAQIDGREQVDAAELRAWLDLRRKSRSDAARTLTDVSRLGIAEQRLALDAARVQIVAELLDRVATGLGHDPADAVVRAVIAREIRGLPQVIEGEVVR